MRARTLITFSLTLLLSACEKDDNAPDEEARRVADRNYSEVHLANGRRFIQARTLGDLEEMLTPHGFIRISRGILLSRAIIDHVEGWQVVLKNGERLFISRRRVNEVKVALAVG